MIENGDTIVIGHNLDDYIDVPGMIMVNKRNVTKKNINWKDIMWGMKKKALRTEWTSKYGSITYNTIGKDFIDGGVNEAGLYIGEMTMFQTQFSVDKNKPSIYHHMWMQYILDNFNSVSEVIDNLNKINIDGTCKWHFFVGDKTGNAAVIEFIDGKPIIYQNDKLPVKILCNDTYQNELDALTTYSGYGGNKNLDIFDKDNIKRFVRGAKIIDNYKINPDKSITDQAFYLLDLFNLGNNKWQVVYDLKNMRLYFKTYKAENIKYIDFDSFDFSCKTPIKLLDIHSDYSGECSSHFVNYTPELNKSYTKAMWKAVNFGFLGNIFIKPFALWFWASRMHKYTQNFSCTTS